ncbi:MAG: hypothetical protein NZ899_10760 [Thermoguttaceae bacterium]|nr:hypothetical protein [Thermoguttaceae bacterium]MDW8078949.1 hypothetical protein [Thermoguttaceae bacterium]
MEKSGSKLESEVPRPPGSRTTRLPFEDSFVRFDMGPRLSLAEPFAASEVEGPPAVKPKRAPFVHGSLAAQVLCMLTHPERIAAAIVVAEILRRPEERWFPAEGSAEI